MTKKTVGVALSILLVTAACSSGNDVASENPSPTEEVSTKRKPLSERDPQAYKMDPGTAMREAPEKLRVEVQKAIVCIVEKAHKEKRPAAINAETIRTVTAHIKSGGRAQDYCNL